MTMTDVPHPSDGSRARPSTTGGRLPARRSTFLAELRDAVSVRTVALILGVLAIQLAFIASYVGAFHDPSPHRIPVAVVAPTSVAKPLVQQIDGATGHPIDASAVTDEAAARRELRGGHLDGALIVDTTGTQDRLLVASGGGASLATAVQTVTETFEAQQHRTVTTTDVVPLQAGDARGLSGFYLVIGWIVGGYLMAALLGVARGAKPTTVRRAAIRLLAAVPYAVLSGLAGALVVGPGLGALDGHVLALTAVGTLTVLAAASVTMAFQALLGVLGIGLTILLFVVLGNPSAGGAYQAPLLPWLWRVLSPVLPNGAATDAVRSLVYFGGNGVGGHVLVIAAWALGGAVVALVASHLREVRGASREQAGGPRSSDEVPAV